METPIGRGFDESKKAHVWFALFGALVIAIDLLIAAAFVQREGWYGRSGLDVSILLDETRFPIETLHTAIDRVSQIPPWVDVDVRAATG